MRNNWKNHISCLRRKLNVCFVYYVIIHSLLLLLHEKRKLRKTHSRSFQIMQRRNFIWLCTEQIWFQTHLTDSTINIQIHQQLLSVLYIVCNFCISKFSIETFYAHALNQVKQWSYLDKKDGNCTNTLTCVRTASKLKSVCLYTACIKLFEFKTKILQFLIVLSRQIYLLFNMQRQDRSKKFMKRK